MFGKFLLEIPADHKIGDIHAVHTLYDRAFGFILEEIARHQPDSVLIDIGANVGDTAAFFATYVPNPIMCVEGSAEFLPMLRANASVIGKQVSVIEAFVQATALRGMPLRFDTFGGTGNFSVVDGDAKPVNVGDDAFLSVEQVLTASQELSPEIGLIKTDTDGSDGVLVVDLIQQAPDATLFFECDTVDRLAHVPNAWPQVFGALDHGGYSVLVFDNFGLPILAASHDVGALLTDLSGYVRFQQALGHTRIYYLDVWAFPPSRRDLFDAVAQQARRDFLTPPGF
jgi:FkbM family methyltransferase